MCLPSRLMSSTSARACAHERSHNGQPPRRQTHPAVPVRPWHWSPSGLPALGRAIGAVEIAAAYATDRSTFGKPLGGHQGVQWMLADMLTQIESSRALITLTAEKYDRGDTDVAIFASMAKMQATDLCMKVVTDALQLTGGRGYLQDFPLERFFRDAKLNQIGEGASEVHKTVIGRDLVRRARNAERNPCLRDGSLVDY